MRTLPEMPIGWAVTNIIRRRLWRLRDHTHDPQ